GPEGADGTDPSVHRGYLSLYTSEDQCSELNKQSARMQVCAPRPAPSLTLLWLYGTVLLPPFHNVSHFIILHIHNNVNDSR
ncbi:hypothetical protein EE612_004692, partial [Oryza sativa]